MIKAALFGICLVIWLLVGSVMAERKEFGAYMIGTFFTSLVILTWPL